MITLGLTGGFGTGKSTVLGMFSRLGAKTLSCDDIVHEELRRNKQLRKKIAACFDIEFSSGQERDRRLLAQRVFMDSRDVSKLNSLIHPVVKKNIFAWLKKIGRHKRSGNLICVVEVPLLFESGFDKIFDATVVVAVNRLVQKKRVSKGSRFGVKDLRLRSSRQWPLDRKIASCDFVIDNNGTRKKTFNQVRKLTEVLLWKS